MPIEFKCPTCEHVLKVADEHAGKSARCPSCKSVVAIPATSSDLPGDTDWTDQPTPAPENPFAGSEAGSSAFASAGNPYATPKATKLEGRPMAGGQIVPTAVGFEDIFSTAWKLFTDHIGILFGASLVVLLVPQGIGFLSGILQVVMAEAGMDEGLILGLNLIVTIFNAVLGLFLGIGLTKICLKIARGQHAEFTELFSGGDKCIPVILAQIAVGLIIFVGFLLLVLPGIYASLVLWPFYYLIIDDKASMSDSISMAYQIGKENILTTLLVGLTGAGLALVGMLLLCIGYFFAYGLIVMITTVAYLKMSGQMR